MKNNYIFVKHIQTSSCHFIDHDSELLSGINFNIIFLLTFLLSTVWEKNTSDIVGKSGSRHILKERQFCQMSLFEFGSTQ